MVIQSHRLSGASITQSFGYMIENGLELAAEMDKSVHRHHLSYGLQEAEK